MFVTTIQIFPFFSGHNEKLKKKEVFCSFHHELICNKISLFSSFLLYLPCIKLKRFNVCLKTSQQQETIKLTRRNEEGKGEENSRTIKNNGITFTF